VAGGSDLAIRPNPPQRDVDDGPGKENCRLAC
jgi:hypothetical protein